jgi:predicted ferric reductase
MSEASDVSQRDKAIQNKNSAMDINLDDAPPAMSFQNFVLLLLAATAGAMVAILVIPIWLPGLSASMGGSAPQAFWFLSRSSASVAYALLWLSMASGLMISNKMARLWPGGPVAFDLHQYASLLGLAFALFHALILMGDHYIHFGLRQVLVPFSSAEYRPVWVGLGQVAFYIMAVVALSFDIRRRIGNRSWRLIHYLSFAMYLLALLHGIFSGTDSGTAWASYMYWISGSVFLFLLIYRLLAAIIKLRPATIKSSL